MGVRAMKDAKQIANALLKKIAKEGWTIEVHTNILALLHQLIEGYLASRRLSDEELESLVNGLYQSVFDEGYANEDDLLKLGMFHGYRECEKRLGVK